MLRRRECRTTSLAMEEASWTLLNTGSFFDIKCQKLLPHVSQNVEKELRFVTELSRHIFILTFYILGIIHPSHNLPFTLPAQSSPASSSSPLR